MAEDSSWGPFEDNKAGWSGLDFPPQPAAEGGLPKEIWFQQFQQEPASEGMLPFVLSQGLFLLLNEYETWF